MVLILGFLHINTNLVVDDPSTTKSGHINENFMSCGSKIYVKITYFMFSGMTQCPEEEIPINENDPFNGANT